MRVRPRDIIQTQQNERARERGNEHFGREKVVDDSGRAGRSGLNSRPTRQRTPVSRGLNSVNYPLSLPACAASSAGHYVAALMMAPLQSRDPSLLLHIFVEARVSILRFPPSLRAIFPFHGQYNGGRSHINSSASPLSFRADGAAEGNESPLRSMRRK